MTEKTRPRDAAKAFTPALADFVDDPLFAKVWERVGLSKRDRSLITVAALVVMYRPEELGAHLRRAVENGVSKGELSEAITHLAFYGGYPAAISASAIAHDVLGALEG
ncbi:carboxymuconolactone decarboxylase family protein [Aliirhizobium cellulosilyticum]|uniref:4-carboxymuconolactone decarboxylase n=1 Tax=Aliirhizobium cellulosilyticum TaxID=393664 RepID=A0A7W6SAH1_9HYPH|nr:carboxymuconolactone decarboxylase family protein [Rhizobium cellulosilyticum]MBB4349347.1 4-carboxymuconolactone decarboxylase [Rhizobium cellulosilyticum]MBB4412431.1 4-carboxymuconolactone decarboxylase [Rhizobium cellulosilyticum]MBB4447063.1 4-carboxymuconolactone decarboxylase [Rhizobium cellulosilyticum]